ncbi:hypothetical protein ABLN97_00830 [Mycobacterium tuberculosis]
MLIGDPAAGDPLLPALQSSLRDRITDLELASAADGAAAARGDQPNSGRDRCGSSAPSER